MRMAEQILRMEHITKIYPNGFMANKDVTFSCEKGSIHALLGENGAGKTTLMKVLFGFLSPDEGDIFVKGERVVFKDALDAIEHGVGMVHQHFMLVDPLTVAENVVLGREPTKRGLFDIEEAVRITGEAARKYNFELDPRAKVEDCSVGIKQKIEILKALLRGAEILILDEPTAVLTPQEAAELFTELRKLRNMGHTIVFISHKLNEVKELCDSFSILRKGQIVQVGRVADYSEQDLSRLMVGRTVKEMVKSAPPQRKAKELMRVSQVSYINFMGKRLLNKVSFSLPEGRILGVAGVEGNGQNELAELITGLRDFHRGDITVDGVSIKGKTVRQIRNLGISNISEDRMTYGCAPMLSVRDNIIADRYASGRYSKGLRLDVKAIQRDVKELVERFDIACPRETSLVGMLSGGNIQKVVVAREFTSGARVVVANQPTRGIDVGAAAFIRDQLVKMTREENVGVLLISADLTEILKLSDSLLVMLDGEITAYFEDAAQVTELELGEYMLGARRMPPEKVGQSLYPEESLAGEGGGRA